MNISLLDSDAIRTITEQKKFGNQQWRKREKRSMLTYLIIGVVLISIDLLTFSDHTFSRTRDGVTVYYDLHLTFGIGIAYLISVMVIAYNMSYYNRKFKDGLQKLVSRYFNRHNYRKIIITDQTVAWETDLMKTEMDWAVVTSFMLLEDALFIIRDSRTESLLAIPRRLLSELEYNELLSFLQRNKPETLDYNKPL